MANIIEWLKSVLATTPAANVDAFPVPGERPITPSAPAPTSGGLIPQLTAQLRRDEDEVLHAYQDHLGYWTIGVGRLIDKRKGGGITPAESAYLLANDINERLTELRRRLPWFDRLDEARRGVLLNMSFQLGVDGLLGFVNTLTMVERGDYKAASKGMLNSLWAKQTPERAKRLSDQMKDGVWR